MVETGSKDSHILPTYHYSPGGGGGGGGAEQLGFNTSALYWILGLKFQISRTICLLAEAGKICVWDSNSTSKQEPKKKLEKESFYLLLYKKITQISRSLYISFCSTIWGYGTIYMKTWISQIITRSACFSPFLYLFFFPWTLTWTNLNWNYTSSHFFSQSKQNTSVFPAFFPS